MVKIRLQNIAETNVTIVQVPIQAGSNSAMQRQHPKQGDGNYRLCYSYLRCTVAWARDYT